MRNLGVSLLLIALLPPAFAAKPVITPKLTVAQLEQLVATSSGVKDGNLAKQLLNLVLTERLSDASFARLEKDLPGPKSREALRVIADESAFLDLPASEIPSKPAPSEADQTALLTKVVDYVTRAVQKLPDFYTTRVTIAYVGTATRIPPGAHNSIPHLSLVPNDERLALAGKSTTVILYRNGRDTYADEKKAMASECDRSKPFTIGSGEFGEILASVPEIVTQGNVSWANWEQDGTGLLAVFRYSAMLPYRSSLSCPGEAMPIQEPIEANGAFAVNPEDGSILRITRSVRGVFAWPDIGQPHWEEDKSLLSYGHVQIGGESYLCPIREVIVGMGPALYLPPAEMRRFDRNFGLSEDPVWDGVGSATFGQYHLFRGDTHILPGISPLPATQLQGPS